MLKTTISLLLLFSTSVSLAADRYVFLIRPNGDVLQSVVSSDPNVLPTNWVLLQADVIILSGDNTPNPPVLTPPTAPPTAPIPPVTDLVTEKITALAKSGLKSKNEAIAVTAIIDNLQKLKLTAMEIAQVIEMVGPIADTSLQTEGRITAFFKAALLITYNFDKMKTGVQVAFDIPASTLDTISAEAAKPIGQAISEPALDLAAIISMIQMIIQLLKSLGII